jgi:hypothetical protein
VGGEPSGLDPTVSIQIACVGTPFFHLVATILHSRYNYTRLAPESRTSNTAMYFSTLALSILVLASSTVANLHPTNSGSAIEALTQAGYKTAWLIDSQNYTAFGEVMTKDVVYDNTDLGAYGGKTNGLEETVAAIKTAGNGARTSHLVTNLLVLDMISPKKARVNT